MFGAKADKSVVAIACIESGSAAITLMRTGATPEVLAYAREDLPAEDRTREALRSGVIQALASAGEKVRATHTMVIGTCYCIIGAPWTRTFAGSAHSSLETFSTVTDAMIGALAKKALENETSIDRTNLLEANVSRILLNGYPTSEPAGKKAHLIDIFTLLSDCDPSLKAAASEAISKLFPGSTIVWRSNTRAALNASKELDGIETGLIVDIGLEATDLISVRKGVFDQRTTVEQGSRHILDLFAKGKPIAETMSLLSMLEKEEGEDGSSEGLRQAIAKAEPDLVHVYGEALAKLSTPRKVPDEMLVVAPQALVPWASRFFARIDFTQFTATAKQFTIHAFNPSKLSGVPSNDPSIFADPDMCMASNLVNNELSS